LGILAEAGADVPSCLLAELEVAQRSLDGFLFTLLGEWEGGGLISLMYLQSIPSADARDMLL